MGIRGGIMARIAFKAGEDYALKLSRLGAETDTVAKKALFAAADIVTDKVRGNLSALPTDKFRYLQNGDKFNGLTEPEKQDLSDSLGITPIQNDKNGDWNVKIGFDGYGKRVTRKYPKGVPNQMLARAVESGSSVRKKTPFVRPAVNATKQQAQETMAKIIEEETKRIMGGN
jgi:HK97 gp10 family phage protein